MNLTNACGREGLVGALRHNFRSRVFFIHDGMKMRRLHLSSQAQVAGVAGATLATALSVFGTIQLGLAAPMLANALNTTGSHDAAVVRMNAKVTAMEVEMAGIRKAAAERGHRLEVRQAMLDALVTGKGGLPQTLPAATPVSPRIGAALAPLAAAEGQQNMFATRLAHVADAKYRVTVAALGRLGLDAHRFHHVSGAMGGPYEPLPTGGANDGKVDTGQPDSQFRALFQSWKRLEQVQQGIVAIPSQRPVSNVTFTSGFGVRHDPFRGGAAMHAGVDMPGAIGTPIYATADGIVGRAQWVNGYGNLVELDHGKGIQTRYGHLSAFVVSAGMRVARGQLIARMGSTGRSTGPHLHYEVRLDGHAVNPMPFLQTGPYLLAAQPNATAMGGPNGD